VEDIERCEEFMELVNSCNVSNGQPQYLEEGYQSSVEVVAFVNYQKLTVSEVQAKLHLHHLVITGMPLQGDTPIEFDEVGLQELTNLDSKIHIQDRLAFKVTTVILHFKCRPINSGCEWRFYYSAAHRHSGTHSRNDARP